MLRRIVSLGQQASESDDDSMTPPAFDAGRSSDAKGPSGLASVFKNLAGTKLTKPPPSASASASASGSGLPTPSSTSSPAALTPSLAAATISSVSIASASQPLSDANDSDSPHTRPHMDTYAACLERLRHGSIDERVAAASALRLHVAESSDESTFEVWHAARDLIQPSMTQAARLAGWELLAVCAKHASPTNLERKEYFQMITARADPGDFHMQLAALIDLSCNGRDLAGFDYDLFPVLTEWFQTAYKASRVAARKPSSSAPRSDSTRSEPKKSARAKGVPTIEDRNLAQLFAYTSEVLRYSSKIASDSAVRGLLSAILDIAMNTSSEDDLFACISVIDTCVVISAMPSKSLTRCVKVLSSIYCLVPKLQKPAWKVLANIFKSHHGLHTMRLLLDTLRNYPLQGVEVKEATREVRGALAVLQKLVRKAGSAEYPVLPYALIVDGLANVADQGPPLRVAAAILQLINQLFDSSDDGSDGNDGDAGALSPLLQDEDWASLLAVATTCAKRSTPSPSFDGSHTRSALSSSGAPVPEEASQDSLNREAAVLTVRIESLVRGLLAERPEHTQRNSCIAFLADVHAILPDSGADLVIKHFNEFHCCFPSDPHWDANLRLVLDAFYANQTRSAAVRLSALQTAIDVQNVLELIDGAIDAPDAVADLARRILARIGQERDTNLLLRATSFAVSIAASVDSALFGFIIESLGLVIKNDERAQPVALASPSSMPASPMTNAASASASTSTASALPDASASAYIDQSTSNIAARGYAQIFMETMNSDAGKAIMAFNALVGVARDTRCPVDARLSALKLLFRLRADWANRIFLVPNPDSEGLAAVLFRTEASLERKMADEVTQEILARQARNEPSVSAPSPPPIVTRPTRGVSFSANASQDRAGMPSRTTSSARPRGAAQRYRQLWSVPDADALPQAPMADASTVLFSHQWDASTAEAGRLAKKKVAQQKRKDEAAARAGQNVSATEAEATPDGPDSEANIGEGQTDQPSLEADDGDEEDTHLMTLDMASWMEVIFDLFTKGTNWELYSFALVHLPSQLSNHAVCRGAIPVILRIRTALCDQIRLNSSQEPPPATGLRRPDVQTCVLQTLTMILSYHAYFQRQEGDDLVRTFITGLTDKNPISCVHALSICCYELPNATSKSLVTILTKMASIITRPGVAVHILELLACLSRLPWLYSNFRDDEYRIAFGVCFRYLQAVREGRITSRASYNMAGGDQGGMGTYDTSGADGPSQLPASLQPNASDDLPQYVYALAYHVLTFWFLALRVADRANYVNWITSRLFIDSDGRQIADEQAQITLDFMQRVAFTDADDSAPVTDPDEAQGADSNSSGDNDFQSMRNWVIGNSILTIQPGKAGFARITKRQPSGTSYYAMRENLQPPPAHQVRGLSGLSGLGDPSVDGSASHSQGSVSVFPSHLLTQLLAPVPQPIDSPLRPILLPADDAVERAFRAFDRNSTIDGHKVGVVYIGEGQTDETEILANISGSSDYIEFLNGLGTLVRLKGATFNTQGLDREYDTDGAYTFCWRDRVTEMVFHVTTQMPTDRERDPICINKKRHIGNDYVNIIFNDSGLPFRFDTFPSEFNYVNIVITPESRASFVARRELSLQKQREDEREALLKDQDQDLSLPPPPLQSVREKRAMPFYKVHVMVKPGFPEISPAARAKIISLKALPDFIRLLALNASVFSQVWANRQGGEHISPWRNRLRQIKRLRERYGAAVHQLPVAPSPPPASMAAGGGGISAGGSSATTPLATVPPPLAGSSLAGGGGGTIGPGGPVLGGGGSGNASGNGGSTEQLSRPSVSGMRDSFNSLRRTSMATFFPVTSADTSSTSNMNQRSSVYSTATAGTGTTGGASDNTDSTFVNGGTDSWLDSLDFSRWT